MSLRLLVVTLNLSLSVCLLIMETTKQLDYRNEGEKEDIAYQESRSDINEEEVEETEKLRNEVTQLSESVFIYPNRKMSDHGNVFEGEIRSGVYGVRVCVIKFARKSEQNVREAKILTKLGSHTHVISIIQSGIYKDMLEERVYVALDKCHEHNLHQHITHQNEFGFELNLNEALEYSKQIVAGVTYVHENLIIHKDLKPSNILLSHDKSTIKLADFGLSQEIKSTSSKVYSKHQFGTNGFRPIESFGNNWASLKSDIFSLGVVLYFILSNGKSPFGDENSLWIYNTHNGVTNLSHHLLVPNSNTFQHLIKLMLNTERCHRPSICQVANHPCWTGKEIECNFDYGFTEEIDNCDVQTPEQENQDSSDSDSEIESQRQLLKAIQKMGIDLSAGQETYILIYDDNSKHIQRFNLKDKTVTRMHEFNNEMKVKVQRFSFTSVSLGSTSGKYFSTLRSFSSVLLGNHIYILMTRSLYRLEIRDVSAKWEQMVDPICDHGMRPPVVVVSGAIYVAGRGAVPATQSVSKYDPSRNRWEKLRNKHVASCDSAIVSLEGYVYCIGGLDGKSETTGRVERMNVVSQTWHEIMPMQQSRWGSSAVECNGKIIVAGGTNHHGQVIDSVEKYDPAVNQWTVMKPMNKGRWYFRCHLVDGNVYAVGGCWWNRDRILKQQTTVEKYDVEKDEWELFHELSEDIFVYDSVTMEIKK